MDLGDEEDEAVGAEVLKNREHGDRVDGVVCEGKGGGVVGVEAEEFDTGGGIGGGAGEVLAVEADLAGEAGGGEVEGECAGADVDDGAGTERGGDERVGLAGAEAGEEVFEEAVAAGDAGHGGWPGVLRREGESVRFGTKGGVERER